jgi:hypothetical protein
MLSLVRMRFTDRSNEADYSLNRHQMTRARNRATVISLQYRLCIIFSLAFYHHVARMSQLPRSTICIYPKSTKTPE